MLLNLNKRPRLRSGRDDKAKGEKYVGAYLWWRECKSLAERRGLGFGKNGGRWLLCVPGDLSFFHPHPTCKTGYHAVVTWSFGF